MSGVAREPVVRMYGVRARDSRGGLTGLDLGLAPGFAGVLLGEPVDGTTALVGVLQGTLPVSGGMVTVDGCDPYRCPEVRRKMAVVGEDPVLPLVGSVADLFKLGAMLRGERAGGRRGWQLLGLEELGGRDVASLDWAERRRVAFGLALDVVEPVVVVLFEPLCDAYGVTLSVVHEWIGQWVEQGSCVLVVTSRVADAAALGCDAVTLVRGRVGQGLKGVASYGERGAGAWMPFAVRSDAPRRLASELLERGIAKGIAWSGGDESPVYVVGSGAVECARGVIETALEQGINVQSIEATVPGLQQINQVGAQVFAAAYQSPVGAVRVTDGGGA